MTLRLRFKIPHPLCMEINFLAPRDAKVSTAYPYLTLSYLTLPAWGMPGGGGGGGVEALI